MDEVVEYFAKGIDNTSNMVEYFNQTIEILSEIMLKNNEMISNKLSGVENMMWFILIFCVINMITNFVILSKMNRGKKNVEHD